jgi:hypothetical protein
MTPNKSTWLALVALPHAELPSPEQVADRLSQHGTAARVSSQSANMATLGWGDVVAAFTLVPQPIPGDALAGPAACAWYWPDAAQALSRHTAHLLVAMVDESPGLVGRAMKFTQFAAAVLETSQAIGIQWGTSRAVHQRESFCELADKMTIDDLPLHLWIDFRVEPVGANQAFRLFTTGLKALGQPEIEVRHFVGDASRLVGYAYNVAHYVLTSKKMLKDGEVLGLTDDLRVTLRVGDSMLGDEQEVVELVFE